MNYNQLSRIAHTNAVEHGFWKDSPSDEHFLMLILSEISEMVEADRKGDRAGVATKLLVKQDTDKGEPFEDVFKSHVKDTVEDEMADVAIRLLDLAGRHCIDFDKLPECRYFRAFRNFTFTENAFALCKGLSKERIAIVKRILFGLEYVKNWAKAERIDLEWHIRAKMQFNASRPALHGKKY